MKKVIGVCCLFFVLLFTANSTMAQLVEWKWAKYKTKFQAPADLTVEKNDETIFSGYAAGKKMNLTIYPRKGENLTYDAMDENLRAWADASNLTGYGDVNFMEDLNGYWGVYVDGKASGYPTSALLLVDPDYPEISLYVWVSYDASLFDTAVEVIKSFTPN